MRCRPFELSFRRIPLLIGGLLLLAPFAALAQARTNAPGPIIPVSTNATIKEISPGVFQIGLVRLEKSARSISFPASLNLADGLVEYLLVHSSGKVHESLLRTDAEPYHVQVALLLLGAKGAPPNTLTNLPPGGQIIGIKDGPDTSPPMPGEPVTVSLQWESNQKTNRVPVEDWIYNVKDKSSMSRGPFAYNGSRVWEGVFIAQREGSIISAITDPDAVINNPRPGRDNDENWRVATNAIPALKTPVTVTISLKAP